MCDIMYDSFQSTTENEDCYKRLGLSIKRDGEFCANKYPKNSNGYYDCLRLYKIYDGPSQCIDLIGSYKSSAELEQCYKDSGAPQIVNMPYHKCYRDLYILTKLKEKGHKFSTTDDQFKNQLYQVENCLQALDIPFTEEGKCLNMFAHWYEFLHSEDKKLDE